MAKTLFVVIALVIVVSLGIYLVITLGGGDNAKTTNQDSQGGNIVSFSLTGENFKFRMDGVDNPDLVVNKGDTVRIELTSIDGFHDFVIDEFDASTTRVQTGETAFVEFTADQTGTFEYYCSVGQHRANGMKGSLIVQ